MPLTADLILQTHAGIFEPVYGECTLGYRTPPKRGEGRRDDGVEFPIWVCVEKDAEPVIVTRRGIESKQVAKRVKEACADFERAAVDAGSDRQRGALALARLYVRLIRIHPFADGNGRTAWAVLQFAAGRLRFPFVQSTPTREARLALGDAIRNGNAIGRLVEHIDSAAWHGSSGGEASG